MAPTFSRKFPDEILLEIVKKLDDAKTLASVSRTSQKLHVFAESYLYSTFAQVDEWGEAIPLFLRTLLRKPHLGRYVKTWIGISCDCVAIEMGKLDRTDFALLQLAVAWVGCNPMDTEKWISLARKGHWDALAAVLLCLLPNLEEINFIEYGSNDGFPYVESVLLRAARLQNIPPYENKSRQTRPKGLHRYPEEKTMLMKLFEGDTEWPPVEFALPNLHRVSLSYEYQDNFPGMSIEAYQILPFLDLKSVNSFKVHMLGGAFSIVQNQFTLPVVTLYKYPLPKFNFHTSELILTHSTLGGTCLERFMCYFTALKRFEYNFDYDFEAADLQDWAHEDCVPPKLTSAIAHLTETLEELSLTQERYREELLSPEADHPIQPLTDFQKLRKLTASANMLLGRHPPHITPSEGGKAPEPHYQPSQIDNFTRLFPPNLEYLIIRHCDSAIFEAMNELLRNTLPPKLKRIELEFQEYCDCGSHNVAEETMDNLAMQRGIALKIYDQGLHSCAFCYEKWARRPQDSRNVGDWSLSQNNWYQE